MSESFSRGADLIARALRRAGCRHVFGIPGGEVLTLLDAMTTAGMGFHLARHETAATFMAEGVYRQTGSPGVVLATLGPGVANAVNGVTNAFLDRVPLVFVTGCIDDREVGRYTHQVFDHVALMRPVTKRSVRLTKDLLPSLDGLIAIATHGRPGPVHLDVPEEVADGLAPETKAPVVEEPEAPDLAPALEQLRRAERPLIIAGLDLRSQADADALRMFAEAWQAPVIATYRAMGVLPPEHPLFLGAAGLSPAVDEVLLPVAGNADVIVGAGYDPIEMRRGWLQPFARQARVVDVVAEHTPHGMHRADVEIVGDVAGVLRGLARELARPASRPDHDETKRRARATFSGSPHWGAQRVFETLVDAYPPDTWLTVDTGAHRILLCHIWAGSRLGRVVQSTGLCTMGCALPLGIGIALGGPTEPVVCVTGDAGLEMVLGELASARDLAVDLTVIVIDDRSLALIERKQRARGLTNVGVDTGPSAGFKGTDYVSIAEGMGAHAWTAESDDELRSALTRARATSGVRLVACRIPRRDYALL